MVISLGAYLAVLAALAIERLIHLALARRNARRALAGGAIEHGRGHYAPIAVFHALFLISSAAEAIILKRPFPGALGWIALGGAAGAQALRYWSIATLGERWNTRIIVFPLAVPVIRGPYRFMRHPNYLAVIVEIACVPLIHGCWLTALVFSIGNAMLLRVRIRAEEAAMGPHYAREFAGRPRLVPKPPPRGPRRAGGLRERPAAR
ncbi:MAG TPA: isoprenylcysteine carboxylmethyltransferase family protein [Candidatus Binataceae bacterium]|nr:isoprenylcysteine carboxylmethyltransferase family protein [Candidatus Binataceae bacterium]